MLRPDRLIAVIGTHTEVGKTWVCRQLLATWKSQGVRVAARKPAQSFDAAVTEPTDAELLAAASGEDPYSVCPRHRWFARAMAPPMAADVLGMRNIRLADLLHELEWPADADLGLVETAGGLCSPLAHDGSNLDFIRLLKPDAVVLVADAGLGTINSIRLSVHALQPFTAHTILNRYDNGNELHRLNAQWLSGDGRSPAISAAELLNQLGTTQSRLLTKQVRRRPHECRRR